MSPEQLDVIASAMNAMRMNPHATIQCDLLSNALFWSDELPELGRLRPRDFWCLRPVLRYRTTLILELPEKLHEIYWKKAQHAFPDWCGFYPSRCQEDNQLADHFRKKLAVGMASLDIRQE